MIAPVIGLCCGLAGLAMVAGPKKKSRPAIGKAPRRAPISQCWGFVWRPGDVDESLREVVDDHLARGEKLVEGDIANHVLVAVYPKTPNGDPIAWPPQSGDCAEVWAIWGRVTIRVRRHLAAIEDDRADSAWFEEGGR